MLPLVLGVAAAAEPTSTAAEPRFGPLDRPASGVGLGLLLGYPAGISAAWRSDLPVFFDLGLGWAWGAFAHIHADAAWTVAELPLDAIPDTHFPLWVGLGARLRFGEGYAFSTADWALRVPVGAAWTHDRFPLEIFVEAVPGYGFYPWGRFVMEGGAGFRFYFDTTEI